MEATLDRRLKAFNRSLDLLASKENRPLWENVNPLIFTTKYGEAVSMVQAIKDAAKNQEAGFGGITEQKDREETELENADFILAQAVALWLADKGREAEAGEIDLSKSAWQGLRDQQLLTKSRLVIERAQSVVAEPDAANYGITPAAITALEAEYADYDEIINAPGVALTIRKALTKGFRSAFNLVEKKFKQLDALILQFDITPAGAQMVAEWKDARLQKGSNGPDAPQPPPVP
jgi:hypothetical protein